MDKLLAVVKREYLERVRTKWFIISTVFGPVFLLAIMILPSLLTMRGMQSAGATNFRIIDATGAGLGPLVAAQIRERALNNPLRNIPGMTRRADSTRSVAEAQVVGVAPEAVAAAESTATLDVMASRIRGYLILDSATVASGKARYAGRNTSSLGEMEQVEGGLRAALLAQRLEAAGITGARADALAKVRADVSTERITSKGRGGSGIASLVFGFVIAFLLYMMIILYGQNILRGVLEEKTTRVAEVVISSISPETLLAGKVIGVGAVGLTQQLVWLAFACGFSAYGLAMAASLGAVSVTMPQVSVLQVVALLLYFLLGYTFYAALFAAVGAMCSSQEEATQAAQPVMMLLVATIILVQPILTAPTGTMATVMSILPFSSPIIMPMVMSGTQVPAWQLAASLASLAIAVYGSIWLSARIYRVGLLMTGKRPSLKELARWVRYS
ncbi:MAG: ABC transporter permease [Gemmatimonadaceae bacterium]|nr:ABC transporter permease [Gemmatimonadaceae bacterium]